MIDIDRHAVPFEAVLDAGCRMLDVSANALVAPSIEKFLPVLQTSFEGKKGRKRGDVIGRLAPGAAGARELAASEEVEKW